jgi:serine/threonine protein kinase
MGVLLDQFIQTLSDSGLMSREDVDRLLAQTPDGERPKDGAEMATLLFRRGKLTKFQAQAVYRGKAKGLILGDYVLLDEIGQGGMGQVYRAQHRRMKRIVAVKILPKEMTKSKDAASRFQQEVEAAARLIHPNIVTAFDAGEQKGIHFLAMEYVDGQDLNALVAARGVLPVADALDYILQAARGLAYAHKEGVVHRDIKPSNLLLDKSGTIKILDMGLARTERQIGSEDETADRGLTRSGDVMGTIDYMSPEQAASTKHVDARTDIYSLGCTLYFLLNARPIYEGGSLAEIVIAHREEPIPRLRVLRDDVPQSLDLAFRRMVGKKPEFRFPSMDEVISALEQCDVPKRPGRGGKPPQSPRSTPETRRPASTQRAASTPTPSKTGAPPPPDLSPRDRTPPPRPSLAARRERTIVEARAQAEVQAKKEERKQAWSDTVQAAVHEQKRKARWEAIRRIVRGGVASITKLVIALALLGGVTGGGYYLWQNNQRLKDSRQQVLSAANRVLSESTFDTVTTVDFTDTSILQPVPPILQFEHALFETTGGGRREVAILRGEFDRAGGTVRFSSPFRGQVKVKPVP